MAFRYSPKIVTDGLVLYLDAANTRSYVSGSTKWYDLSKSGNTGTVVNTPSFNSLNGGSLVFNGSNTYVETNQIKPTNFTLSSWFKATGAPTNNDSSGGALIVSSPQLFGGSVQYSMNYSWLNQRVVFAVQTNTGSIAVTPNDIVLRNKIYNATSVYTGSKSQIYINGSFVSEITYTTNPIYPTTGNINVQIGRWGYPLYTRQFNGNIYQTSIYNRALSPSEILQNYNSTKSRFGL